MIKKLKAKLSKLFLLFCTSKQWPVKEQVLFSFQKVSSICGSYTWKQCPMFSGFSLSQYPWMELSKAVDCWRLSVKLYLAVVTFSCIWPSCRGIWDGAQASNFNKVVITQWSCLNKIFFFFSDYEAASWLMWFYTSTQLDAVDACIF